MVVPIKKAAAGAVGGMADTPSSRQNKASLQIALFG
jgi:hypothetical protein